MSVRDKIDREKWCARRAKKLATDYLPRVLSPSHREYPECLRKLIYRFDAALRLATATTHPPLVEPLITSQEKAR